MDILKNKIVQVILAGLAVYFGFPFIGLGAIKVYAVIGVGVLVYLKK